MLVTATSFVVVAGVERDISQRRCRIDLLFETLFDCCLILVLASALSEKRHGGGELVVFVIKP